MTTPITGLWVALATPLTPDAAVDHPTLIRHIQHLEAQGCDGFVPFGTTGEGPSFSAAERLETVEALLTAGIDPNRIALGTGCPAIPDTIALTKGALDLGLHHALILPPYFFHDATDEGIEDAFAAIIDGVGDDRLRATLYHIPQVSGVPVPAAAVRTLRAKYKAIVAGVKDSTGDFASFQAFRTAAPDLAITVGSEVLIARALAEGGAGTICGMANLVPGLVRAQFDGHTAEEMMRQACDLMAAPFLPTLKATLAAQTGEAAWARVRPPLRAIPLEVGGRIATALRGVLQHLTA